MMDVMINYIAVPGIGHKERVALSYAVRKSPKTKQTAFEIISSCAACFGIEYQDIISYTRTRDFSEPRTIAIFHIYSLLKLPKIEIAKIFGRNHATIIYNINKYEDLIEVDKQFQGLVKKYHAFIKN